MKTILQIVQGISKEINEEMLGKTFTLIDMDNKIIDILDSWDYGDTLCIFNDSPEDCIKYSGFNYHLHISESDANLGPDICVAFDVIEKNEDVSKVVVKVTDVKYEFKPEHAFSRNDILLAYVKPD